MAEVMAGDELAQLLTGPPSEDWLGAADFEEPDHVLFLDGAGAEGVGCGEENFKCISMMNRGEAYDNIDDFKEDKQIMVTTSSEMSTSKMRSDNLFAGSAIQSRGMDCLSNARVVPGSMSIPDVQIPAIPTGIVRDYRDAATRTQSLSSGDQSASDVFEVTSSNEGEPSYPQTKTGGMPGLMIPEPLGFHMKRTAMYSMGEELFNRNANSADWCPATRKAPFCSGAYHLTAPSGFSVPGQAVNFPSHSQSPMPINRALAQGLGKHFSMPLSGSQSKRQPSPVRQLSPVGCSQQGTILSDYDAPQFCGKHLGSLRHHCGLLHSANSLPSLGPHSVRHEGDQEWGQSLQDLSSSTSSPASGDLSPSSPGTALEASENFRKCSHAPILSAFRNRTCLRNSPSKGEIQLPKMNKLTKEERWVKIMRYKRKKKERRFEHRVTYQCRKTLADSRPRVRGRFAKSTDKDAVLPSQKRKRNLGDSGIGEGSLPLEKRT